MEPPSGSGRGRAQRPRLEQNLSGGGTSHGLFGSSAGPSWHGSSNSWPLRLSFLLPTFATYFRALRRSLRAWARTPRGQQVLKIGRYMLTAAVIGFLVYQLATIGWGDVARAIPTAPWFYVLWAIAYVRLPVIEMLIYRRVWKKSRLALLYAFLRKRALNADVVGYSGEVYLLAWARKAVPEPADRLWKAIKDNLIMSSLSSVGTAVVMLLGLALSGLLDPWLGGTWGWYAGGAVVITALIIALLVQFRGTVFSFPPSVIAWMGGWHSARFFIGYVLSVTMWGVVLPDVPMATWALLLTLFILTDRIPVIPSRDLLFVGVSLELSATMGVPEAALAGLLLTQTVLGKIVNFVFFLSLPLYWYVADHDPPEKVEPPIADAEAAPLADGAPQASSSSSSPDA